MPAMVKLSSSFRIGIPKRVRDALAWRADQEFVLIPKGAGVLVMPVPQLDDIIGLSRGVKDRNFRDRKDRF